MLEIYSSLLNIIIRQQQTINDLSEKVGLSSDNSSIAPSNDLNKRKKKKKINILKPTGKKQGAQPGHKGVNRAIASISDVNNVINCYHDSHCSCGCNQCNAW